MQVIYEITILAAIKQFKINYLIIGRIIYNKSHQQGHSGSR